MPALLFIILGNRFAQLAIALILGWAVGWWRTDASWREHVAREMAVKEAAYKVEIERQRAAAAEIAQAATDRLQYEITRANDMAERIRQLQLTEAAHEPQQQSKLICKDASGKLAPVVVRPCRLDRADVNFLQSLDAGNRTARPARRTGSFWKSR